MDQKENDKYNGIKNIKIKAKGIHIQKHKCNYPDAKHDDEQLNSPLLHMPDTD